MITRILFTNALVIFLFALAGCLGDCFQHPRDEVSATPDHECQTGTAHGYDIAIWECHENERVVAWRESGEMSCSVITVERTQCGGETEFEQNLSTEEVEECYGVVTDGGPASDGGA